MTRTFFKRTVITANNALKSKMTNSIVKKKPKNVKSLMHYNRMLKFASQPALTIYCITTDLSVSRRQAVKGHVIDDHHHARLLIENVPSVLGVMIFFSPKC